MSEKSYYEKFKDPRWQKKRLEIFSRDDFKCVHCGSNEKTLHAHHLCYFSGQEPWEYDEIFIVTLCDGCHGEFHNTHGLSEYFLTREFSALKSQIDYFDSQKSYDIGGIMRYFKTEFLSLTEDNFEHCKVERIFNKESGNIEFKLIEENEDDN